MIKFKLGGLYHRYNANHEVSYCLSVLSRKESDGKTIVRYIIAHYNVGHLTDIDDCDIEVGETPVCYGSDTEVLYIKGFKVFIPADMRNTDYYITSYKEYIHKLITDTVFLRKEVDNIEKYDKSHNVRCILIGIVLKCSESVIDKVIFNCDIIDVIALLVDLSNELMNDIEKSDGIYFYKPKEFLRCTIDNTKTSQISKFVLIDTIYENYKGSIKPHTRNIIENLINTYLSLT